MRPLACFSLSLLTLAGTAARADLPTPTDALILTSLSPDYHHAAFAALKHLPPTALPALHAAVDSSATPDHPFIQTLTEAAFDITTRHRQAYRAQIAAEETAWSAALLTAVAQSEPDAARRDLLLRAHRTLPTDRAAAHALFKQALAEGSKDPLARYHVLRRALDEKEIDSGQALKELAALLPDLDASRYPAAFQFLPHVTAVQWRADAGNRDNQPNSAWHDVQRALALLPAFTAAHPPRPLLYRTLEDLHTAVAAASRPFRDTEKTALDTLLPVLAAALPNDPAPAWLEAHAYRAWAITNAPYDQTGKPYTKRITYALDCAARAWRQTPLDPTLTTLLFQLHIDNTSPGLITDAWFARAMAVDPDNLAAARIKLAHLLFHDPPAALPFARDLAAAAGEHSALPRLLIEAHEALIQRAPDRIAYLRDDQNWRDIQTAYAALLERPLLPTDDRTTVFADRAAYIRLVCDAQDWSAADALFTKFGDDLDPKPLGGRAMLNFLKRKAQQKSAN